MSPFRPIADLPTHEVVNQPPPLVDHDLFAGDRALSEAVAREGSPDSVRRAAAFGAELGREVWLERGEEANRHPPELVAFDRYGHRVDEVRFHPAWHELMRLGMAHRQHAMSWSGEPGAHVSHAALEFLMHQVEAGVCCPLSMTCAAIPVLRQHPVLAAQWEPLCLSDRHDPACLPVTCKSGATIGMAMTEKQGGSDVRSNSTRAEKLSGSEDIYILTGHKWFCSAPMCDAFLTLAVEDGKEPGAPSCFFVPRWTPDGERNRIFIQRLKDKLGNRSNASAEIDYSGTRAWRIGAPGRGIATILEMVHHTRLDTAVGAASLMRRALAEAIHHARHRTAFQRRLVDQPLMANLLADLAIESEAATVLAMRVARAFDDSAGGADQRAFARLIVAIAKFWLNKRVIGVVAEALEVHGGSGYVEDGPMARLYREAPLNGIWEGSGNIIALDILRSLDRAPEAVPIFLDELRAASGADRRLDQAIARLADRLAGKLPAENEARRLAGEMAVTLEAALLVRHAPACVADAFVASRPEDGGGRSWGCLPGGLDCDAIIRRAAPGAPATAAGIS